MANTWIQNAQVLSRNLQFFYNITLPNALMQLCMTEFWVTYYNYCLLSETKNTCIKWELIKALLPCTAFINSTTFPTFELSTADIL